MQSVNSGRRPAAARVDALTVSLMTAEAELIDEALRQEIELVGDLVVAASAVSGRMCQEDVDQVLGVRCA